MLPAPTYDDALRALTGAAALVAAPQAVAHAPRAPGLYAISVARADALPPSYSEHLGKRGTTLIYLGKATRSLRQRLGQAELRNKGRATFFRSLGAVLGYRPPPGQKHPYNYYFSPADTAAIVAWIDAHLLVRWVALPRTETAAYEPRLIGELRPLLNLAGNPARLPALDALRRLCRQLATGPAGGLAAP